MNFLKWLFGMFKDECGQLFPGETLAERLARVSPGAGGVPAGSGGINLETEFSRLLRSPFEVPTDPTELELAGIETLRQAADPTQRLARARERFEQFASPEIIAALTAAGLGRSGAVGENLARGFADVAAPIEQAVAQAQNVLGQQQLGLGSRVAERRTNRETALVERALRILGQLQSLRTAQAGINASVASSRVSRGAGTPFSQFPRASSVVQPNTGFRDPSVGRAVAPTRTSSDILADLRATQALLESRFPTGASFISPTSPDAGSIPQGTRFVIPGGTLRVSGQPTTLRRSLFG